jgi:hypothetical protein
LILRSLRGSRWWRWWRWPVPPILLTRRRKAGGRAADGLGLTAAVSLLSVVLVPALVALLGTVAAIIVLTVLGLAFGHILAGPWGFCGAGSRQRCPAPGHRLAVAGANFPSLDVGAVIILYLLIGAVVAFPTPSGCMSAPQPCRLRPRSGRSEGYAAGVPGCRGLAGSPGLLHAGILRVSPA